MTAVDKSAGQRMSKDQLKRSGVRDLELDSGGGGIDLGLDLGIERSRRSVTSGTRSGTQTGRTSRNRSVGPTN
jgi:hypothetical protein